MGLFSRRMASELLEDMLERERKAALGGRFDLLERLVAEKERLIAVVAREGADAETLARLKAGAERNGRLLQSMRDGVAAAKARLSALGGRGETLQTYDAEGRRRPISRAANPADRRA